MEATSDIRVKHAEEAQQIVSQFDYKRRTTYVKDLQRVLELLKSFGPADEVASQIRLVCDTSLTKNSKRGSILVAQQEQLNQLAKTLVERERRGSFSGVKPSTAPGSPGGENLNSGPPSPEDDGTQQEFPPTREGPRDVPAKRNLGFEVMHDAPLQQPQPDVPAGRAAEPAKAMTGPSRLVQESRISPRFRRSNITYVHFSIRFPPKTAREDRKRVNKKAGSVINRVMTDRLGRDARQCVGAESPTKYESWTVMDTPAEQLIIELRDAIQAQMALYHPRRAFAPEDPGVFHVFVVIIWNSTEFHYVLAITYPNQA